MKRFFALAGLHWVLFMGLLMYSLDFSAIDGEDPGLPHGVTTFAVEVLGQPGFAVRRAFGPDFPDAVEWGLVVGNSLLWGAVLGALLRRRRRKDARA